MGSTGEPWLRKMIVKRVLRSGSNIRHHQSEPLRDNRSVKFFLLNIPLEWPEETLENFVEVVTKASLDDNGVERVNHIKHSALLTFSQPISEQHVQNAKAGNAQKGKQLEFLRIQEAPSSILVRDVTPNLTHDNLLYYFDSHHAGGQEGEVMKCRMYTHLSLAVVKFSSHEVAAGVLARKEHIPSKGNNVRIEPFYDAFHELLLTDQEEHFTSPLQPFIQRRELSDSNQGHFTVTNTSATNHKPSVLNGTPSNTQACWSGPPPLKPKPAPKPHWAQARNKLSQSQNDCSSGQQHVLPHSQPAPYVSAQEESREGIRSNDGNRRSYGGKRGRNKRRNRSSKRRFNHDENLQETPFMAMNRAGWSEGNSYQSHSSHRGRQRGRGCRGNSISKTHAATELMTRGPGHENSGVASGQEQGQSNIPTQADQSSASFSSSLEELFPDMGEPDELILSTEMETHYGSVSPEDVELFTEQNPDLGPQKTKESSEYNAATKPPNPKQPDKEETKQDFLHKKNESKMLEKTEVKQEDIALDGQERKINAKDYEAKKQQVLSLMVNAAVEKEQTENEEKKKSEAKKAEEMRLQELAKKEIEQEKERQLKQLEQEQEKLKQQAERLKMETQALLEEKQRADKDKHALELKKQVAERKSQQAQALLEQANKKWTELKNRKKWTEKCPAFLSHFMHDFVKLCTICDIEIHEKDGTVDFTGTEDRCNVAKCAFFEQIQEMAADCTSLPTEVIRILQTSAGRQYLDQLSRSLGCSYEVQESVILCASPDGVAAVNHFMTQVKNDIHRCKIKVSKNLALQMQNLKQQLEEKYPLICITLPDANQDELIVDGIKDDVQLAHKGVQDFLTKNQPETGVFRLDHALEVRACRLWFTQQLDQVKDLIWKNKGEVTVDSTTQVFTLKYECSKNIAQVIKQKLNDIKKNTKVTVIDPASEFSHPEKSLVINGLHNKGEETFCRVLEEKLKKTGQESLITLTLPPRRPLPKLKIREDKKSPAIKHQPRFTPQRTPRQTGHHQRRGHWIHPFTARIGSSSFTVTSGDIASENVDGLVCIVGEDLDLNQTAVGQAILKKYPSVAQAQATAAQAPSSLQGAVGYGNAGSPGQVITKTIQRQQLHSTSKLFLAVLTNWSPNNLEKNIKLIVQGCLQSAVNEGIRSLAIPPLGIGRRFQFPEDTISKAMVYTVYRFLQDNPGVLKDLRLVIFDTGLARKFRETAKQAHQPDMLLHQFIPGLAPQAYDSENDDNSDNDDNADDNDGDDDDIGDEDTSASDENDLFVFDTDDDDDQQTFPKIAAAAPLMHFSTAINLTAHICLHSPMKDLQFVKQALQQELRSSFVFEDRVDDLKTLMKLGTKSMHEIQTLATRKDTLFSIRSKGDKKVLFVQGQEVCVLEVVSVIKDKIFAHNHHTQRDDAGRRFRQGALPSPSEQINLPKYWAIQQKGTFKSLEQWVRDHRKYGKLYTLIPGTDGEYKDILHLINTTWDKRFVGQGKDGRNLSHSSMQVVKVERLEDPNLWEVYWTHRERLIRQIQQDQKVRGFPPVEALRGSTGPVLTSKHLSRNSQLLQGLVPKVNEHYLFHGTKKEFVDHIITNGMDFRIGSGNAMLGKGIYASESSTKADQYTDNKQQRTSGHKTMILMRMLLGHAFINKNVNPTKYNRPPCTHCFEEICKCKPVSGTHFDAVIDDAGRNFREFVVYEKCMCYPEYFITYQRV